MHMTTDHETTQPDHEELSTLFDEVHRVRRELDYWQQRAERPCPHDILNLECPECGQAARLTEIEQFFPGAEDKLWAAHQELHDAWERLRSALASASLLLNELGNELEEQIWSRICHPDDRPAAAEAAADLPEGAAGSPRGARPAPLPS
jgi:hypothetical protein